MPDEIDHIADLQQRLYARDPESAPKRKVGILRPLKNEVGNTWGETALTEKTFVKKPAASGYKRFFIVSFIFFLIALGAALFSIYRGAVTLSSKNVEVTILGNSFVAGGESLPVQIDIANKNSTDLVEATLTLAYPRGSVDTAIGEMERIKKDIGTVGSGKTKTEEFSVVLYGEQGMSRTVTATLEYKLAGSNATFVKDQTFSVMINSSPVALVVDAPSAVASNQPFTLNIRTTFSGDTLLDNAVVRIEYPNGFLFGSAFPAPSVATNSWDLGDLVKGTERTITIKGKLIGEQQDEKSFRVYVGARTSESDARIAVAYNSALHSVTIAEPLIAGRILIGSAESDVVAFTEGGQVSGSVVWTNNAPITMTNPVFSLSIVGSSVDTESIEASDGYYDALEKTIVWNSETSQSLLSLPSGATGILPFRFDTLSSDEGTPEDITLILSMKGTFPDRDFFEDSVTGIDQKVVRFAAQLQAASQALYSVGAIKNTGPFPPKALQETTYTINWIMRPVESTLSDAVATAVLPPGVVWTGVVVPTTEAVIYTPETRTVRWSIGGMPKAGPAATIRAASFQVSVRPTKAQIGSDIDLLGETVITATDTAANAALTLTRPPLSTELSTDPAYSAGKEKVLP